MPNTSRKAKSKTRAKSKSVKVRDLKAKKSPKAGTSGNTVYVAGASGGVWKSN